MKLSLADGLTDHLNFGVVIRKIIAIFWAKGGEGVGLIDKQYMT